ncbi:MAG TPA: hypothetical protein VLF94_07340 [Chlamydiales bacterium]|nr:hypothetical protein [Chlamydiales bacterium]
MEKKKVKKFIYEGLGFPIVLVDVTLVKKRDIWTPAIDYNKLQKEVLMILSHKPFSITGNEVHFIRAYFEMTLESFGKQFGVTHPVVLNWEKTRNKSAKINPATELCIRLFILEKLKISNQIFRETFREFNMQEIAAERKETERKPLILPGSFTKRPSIRV